MRQGGKVSLPKSETVTPWGVTLKPVDDNDGTAKATDDDDGRRQRRASPMPLLANGAAVRKRRSAAGAQPPHAVGPEAAASRPRAEENGRKADNERVTGRKEQVKGADRFQRPASIHSFAV